MSDIKLLISDAVSNAFREPFVVDKLVQWIQEKPGDIDKRYIPVLIEDFENELKRVEKYKEPADWIKEKEKHKTDYEKFVLHTQRVIEELRKL